MVVVLVSRNLYLNKKEKSFLVNNFLEYWHIYWSINPSKLPRKNLTLLIHDLFYLKEIYPKNIIFSYLNVTSFRYNLDGVIYSLMTAICKHTTGNL